MQKLAEFGDVPAANEDIGRLEHQGAHAVQRRGLVGDRGDLLLCHVGSRARNAGIDQQQIVLELALAERRDRHGPYFEAAVPVDLDEIEPAERGGDLILNADILAEQVLLEMNGLLSELLLGDEHALQRIKRVQDADGEGRARAEPRARRQVAVMMNLEPFLDAEISDCLAYRRMRDVPGLTHELDARPDDAMLVLEEWRIEPAAQMTIAVDRGGQHGTAMVAIPVRVIGPAAEE